MKLWLARMLDRAGQWCIRRSFDLSGWPVASEQMTERFFAVGDAPFHMPPDVAPAEDFEQPQPRRK